MNVAMIQVPYDSGHCEERMGRGPGHLLAHGAAERVERATGGTAIPARVDADATFPTENATAFELAAKLSAEVARARDQGAFPLVLAGNCMSSVGTVSGLSEVPRLGVIWFDAHGDLNTPETSGSGFLDGMPAAILTGRCWRKAAARVPGFRVVPDAAMLHAGGRAIDPGEDEIMDESGIRIVTGQELRDGGAGAIAPALEALAGEVDAVYLHLDLDVHDGDLIPANALAVPGGPTWEQMQACVKAIAARLPIAAAAVTAFDPGCERDGRATEAGLGLIEAVAAGVAAR